MYSGSKAINNRKTEALSVWWVTLSWNGQGKTNVGIFNTYNLIWLYQSFDIIMELYTKSPSLQWICSNIVGRWRWTTGTTLITSVVFLAFHQFGSQSNTMKKLYKYNYDAKTTNGHFLDILGISHVRSFCLCPCWIRSYSFDQHESE